MKTLQATVQTERHGFTIKLDSIKVLEGDGIEFKHDGTLWYTPYVIGHEFGPICIVFARCESDALDYVADAGLLDGSMVSAEDYEEMTEDEREELFHLGNAGEPFDVPNLWIDTVARPVLDGRIFAQWTEEN